MSMYTDNPEEFLNSDTMEGIFDEAWSDVKSAASDTIDKWTKAGKKAIGLDTEGQVTESGGTTTEATPEAPAKSNTLLWVGLAAGGGLLLWLAFKPKKRKRKY